MPLLQTVKLEDLAAQEMKYESHRRYPYETGGILIGRYENGYLTVTQVVGPGPQAQHELSRFIRDGDYAQQELDMRYHESAGRDDYIGEWHSHPAPVRASFRDRESMNWISKSSEYQLQNPILIICQYVTDGMWIFQGYQWQKRNLVNINIEVI